ncbi:MAG: endonuclease/exonuclease/phosphatase family protein [Cyclobacteriaceae bacterium]
MKYFNFFAALLLLIIYSLGRIPPSETFNLWLVTFIIPIGLVMNIIFMVTGILMKKKSALYFLIVLVAGSNYLFSTIGVKSLFKARKASPAESFTVLNYNVSAFNEKYVARSEGFNEMPDSEQSALLEWVISNESDIQCYQEVSYSPASPDADLLGIFRKHGYDYYFSASPNWRDSSYFGILIISRFPMISKGDVIVSENGFNRICYADIGMGRDTIRIVNVHLQSMQMKGFHPGFSETIDDRTRSVRVVLRKLKSGVFERSRQIKQLIEFVEASPYPVICAGDFNELPYSFSYQMLKRHLRNSFEESGRGFGFTYNGNTLGMLRIDNQFYSSSSLRSLDFQTLDTVKFTDHFPVSGSYILRN